MITWEQGAPFYLYPKKTSCFQNSLPIELGSFFFYCHLVSFGGCSSICEIPSPKLRRHCRWSSCSPMRARVFCWLCCGSSMLQAIKSALTHYYCWWKKSCTTWDVWNTINNGKNYLSTGAGFQPSTVGIGEERNRACFLLSQRLLPPSSEGRRLGIDFSLSWMIGIESTWPKNLWSQKCSYSLFFEWESAEIRGEVNFYFWTGRDFLIRHLKKIVLKFQSWWHVMITQTLQEEYLQ